MKLKAIALGAAIAFPLGIGVSGAALAQAGGQLNCMQDLEQTRALFKEQGASLKPAVAEAIADRLSIYDSRCRIQGSGRTVAADLSRIRSVIEGRGEVADLPTSGDAQELTTEEKPMVGVRPPAVIVKPAE